MIQVFRVQRFRYSEFRFESAEVLGGIIYHDRWKGAAEVLRVRRARVRVVQLQPLVLGIGGRCRV